MGSRGREGGEFAQQLCISVSNYTVLCSLEYNKISKKFSEFQCHIQPCWTESSNSPATELSNWVFKGPVQNFVQVRNEYMVH
jgi:hypothetical protein